MSINSLKKYKHAVIKLKTKLTWDEYVSTLFFIKNQKEILIKNKETEGSYKKITIDTKMLNLILSYNTKILIKIKSEGNNDRVDNLISANKKIYKSIFALTNFKIDIFKDGLEERFGRLKSKERTRVLKLIEENYYLFNSINLEGLKELDGYLKENKPNAIDYFNKVNDKINIFLRDKNL